MDGAAWGFIGALAGAALGALASIVTTVVQNRNVAQLQLQADLLDRTERARAFQRDNLIALQEALQDVARSAGRTFHEDAMANRGGTEWGKLLLSDELDTSALAADRRLSALVERVQDDALREQVRAVHSEFRRVPSATSERDAEAHLMTGSTLYTEAMRHLGEVLRGLY